MVPARGGFPIGQMILRLQRLPAAEVDREFSGSPVLAAGVSWHGGGLLACFRSLFSDRLAPILGKPRVRPFSAAGYCRVFATKDSKTSLQTSPVEANSLTKRMIYSA